MKIEIGNKEYEVQVLTSEEEKEVGLQGRESLPENEGLLFVNEEPEDVSYWMKGCNFPIDIIFINENNEVISVKQGKPNDETLITETGVKYVLEVNINSGIQEGDDLELEEETSDVMTMQVLGSNGEVQAEILSGSRIFSRPNTKTLIRLAKSAFKSKEDKDYKALGRKVFQFIKTQDTQKQDFVQLEKGE